MKQFLYCLFLSYYLNFFLLIKSYIDINEKNGFDKNDSIEIEFYNKLANLNIKRKEFIVDREALKRQQATNDQIEQYEKSQKIKDNSAKYEGVIQFTNEKKQLEFEKSKLEAQKNSLKKA